MKQQDSGQMIILMGIVLSLSIFVLSNLAADIINLDTVISNEHATSIVSEFAYIKGTFGISMNYYLINNVSVEGNGGSSKLVFKGNPDNITKTFNKTRDEFYLIELRYGNNFDAKLNKYWYSNIINENYVYYVDVTLSLDDGQAHITDNTLYSIVCKP